jgi:hypothetical protein
LQLWRNIDRALNKASLNQSRNYAAEILYNASYKKFVPVLSRPTPDAIVFPGHVLIYEVTAQLFHLGAPDPGHIERKCFRTEDDFFNTIKRGARYPGTYASMLPLIGKYILHLWLVNYAWWKPEADLYILDPKKSIEFGMKYSSDGSSCFPRIQTYATELEWCWLLRLVRLAGIYGEADANLIPYYWPHEVPYREDMPLSVESAKQDPFWAKRRAELERLLSSFPYSLRFDANENGELMIVAKAQYKPQELTIRTMSSMGKLEGVLRQTINNISCDWGKLRASHDLERSDINDHLRNAMRWLVKEWPGFYREDSRLSTTGDRMTTVQSWKEPSEREYMMTLRKDIEKVRKRADDYGPGNIGRVTKELAPGTEKIIAMLIPDLKKILDHVWPFGDIKDISEKRNRVENLKFSLIRWRHYSFPWNKIKRNDRLRFCSRIVRNYLRDKTSVNYELGLIYKTLSGKLPRG